jgi:hypothetical protein
MGSADTILMLGVVVIGGYIALRYLPQMLPQAQAMLPAATTTTTSPTVDTPSIAGYQGANCSFPKKNKSCWSSGGKSVCWIFDTSVYDASDADQRQEICNRARSKFKATYGSTAPVQKSIRSNKTVTTRNSSTPCGCNQLTGETRKACCKVQTCC